MRSLSSNSLAPPVSSLPSVLPVSPHPQLLPTPQARPKPAEAPWCSIPKDLPVVATSAPLILMLASSVFEPEAGGGGDEREKEGKKKRRKDHVDSVSLAWYSCVCY